MDVCQREFLRKARIQEAATRRDGSHRFDQRLRRAALRQKSQRAFLQRAAHEPDHREPRAPAPRLRMPRTDALQRFEPTHAGHREIHHDYIR